MRRRLARMSPAARNVAAVAASMGRRFTVAQLAAVLEVPASALLGPVQRRHRRIGKGKDTGRVCVVLRL
jgi:predicted ATPase